MKTRRTIEFALLITLAAAAGYWLGYERGRTVVGGKLNTVNSLRQLDLRFREGHNDMSRFSATDDATPAKTQTQ